MGIFLDNTYTTTMNKLLPKDLWGSVFEFIEPKVYTLPDWVLEGIKKQDDQDDHHRSLFSFFGDNPKAIHILEKNLDKVSWWELSLNPAAIHLLEQNLDKVSWWELSYNPAAIHILEKNLDKVNWGRLSANPAAVHILEQNLDKVDWGGRLKENPAAIRILEKNLDKVDWGWLSANPAAIHLLEQNLDKVDWELLSENPNIFVVDEKETRKLIKKKVDEFLE